MLFVLAFVVPFALLVLLFKPLNASGGVLESDGLNETLPK